MPTPRRVRWLRRLTGAGLLALLVVVAVRLLGAERGDVLVLLIGALPLTLLATYPLLAVAVALRARLLTGLALLLVAAHVAVVAPTVGARSLPPGTAQAPRLRVVTSNLYVDNPRPEAAGRALRALHPDVLVVPELTERTLAGLERSGLLADLRYRAVALEGRTEDVGLFSRLPLDDLASTGSGTRLLPRATVEVGGVAVRVMPAHPLPPVRGWESSWRRSLTALRGEIRHQDLPVVAAGDFNSDRDHAPFRALLSRGVRDAADERGHGLARTWPSRCPLLQLDHVLVRDGRGGRIVVRRVHEVRIPGSDHRAVVADLAVLR